MKILLFLFTVIVASLQVVAEQTTKSSTTNSVGLEVGRTDNAASGSVHRAPMRHNLYVDYDDENKIIHVHYLAGDVEDIFLFFEGDIVGYDTEGITSFKISKDGVYYIEIVTLTGIVSANIAI